MYIRNCLILSFIFILAACSTNKVENAEQKYNHLEVGMSMEQVKTLLGEPSLREARDEKEVWYYSAGLGRDIEFKNKKLLAFHRPKKEETTVPVGFVPPKDIGDKCNSDKECLSQDCLLGRCVGPNNCWRKVGQTCSNPNDCCGSKCDFGICKQER